MLLSKSHNCAVGNIPFSEKLATYVNNEQQRELKSFISEKLIWDREAIKKRKEKIINVIIENC